MIAIRRSAERGHTNLGWLDSRHTFSFGDYRDPDHMGFRNLRVINEDRVEPGEGFGTHGHRDMEIVSYVLEGELEHKDSMGTGSVIVPGDVQRMSAGTGVTHSEYNPSDTEKVHFLQIWILPEREGMKPGYEQKSFPVEARKGRARLVASPDGRDGSVTVHTDALIYASLLDAGDDLSHELEPGRNAWLQIARGAVRLEDQRLGAGDGAAITTVSKLMIKAEKPSEILIFDLP